MDTIPHGGRLQQARRRYPGAPSPFLDLSTGINPNAYPFTPPGPDAYRRLPETEDLQRLEAAAATAYGVNDPAMVVAAPGTQALIQLMPRLMPIASVAIPGPTYAEHAATWRQSGATVHDTEPGHQDAAVICNPNNPDGKRHDPAALAGLARSLKLLVIDEAFADFEPGLTAAPLLPVPGLVILRSFGKSYGLAGIRLGFALAEPALAHRIRTMLGPWAVSGPAMVIGTQALSDPAWRTDTAAATHASAARLDTMLTAAGMQVLGGTCLYRLATAPDAAALADHLARQGILVRTFDYASGWVRFGLPDNEEAWTRLRDALSANAHATTNDSIDQVG